MIEGFYLQIHVRYGRRTRCTTSAITYQVGITSRPDTQGLCMYRLWRLRASSVCFVPAVILTSRSPGPRTESVTTRGHRGFDGKTSFKLLHWSRP